METIDFPMLSWLNTSGFASTCITGKQWGDEGKGKVVDFFAQFHDIIMRYNGGNNAGHTLDDITTHLIPSGIQDDNKTNVMAQGMVISAEGFCNEVEYLRGEGIKIGPKNLVVSPKAHVILKHEVALDVGSTANMIGTTKKGIGPAYEQKAARTGVRVVDMVQRKKLKGILEKSVASVNARLPKDAQVDLYDVEAEAEKYGECFAEFMGDVKAVLKNAYHKGKKVLFEGAQGALLDVDNGTYPDVTSSNTTRPSVGQTGYYLPVTKALGVFKAPMSRVGKGPFPSEWGGTDGTNETRHLIEEEMPLIERVKKFMESGPDGYEKGMMERGRIEQGKRKLVASLLEKLKGGKATDLEKGAYFGWKGMEFGATTGRARRLGPLDLPLARYVAEINGLDGLVFTKWDIYSGTGDVEFATKYSYNNLRVHERNVDDLSELDFLSLDTAVPLFKRLPGWKENIRGMNEWRQLPEETKTAIKFAEKAIGIPCLYFSTGPKKDEMIAIEGRK